MLPIDIVRSGKALNESFDKAQIDMEGFIHVLAGAMPQKSGIKTFEIQYNDKDMNADLLSKQNDLPASLFVEINWSDDTIRTFFAIQPTIGDGYYQTRRTPFYTFDSDALYGHNGIEHYDYPAIIRDNKKFGEGGDDLIVTIHNKTRRNTHEPRHEKQGAFAQWLLNNVHKNTKLKFTAFHLDIKPRGSHILNWKQGIEWMDKS